MYEEDTFSPAGVDEAVKRVLRDGQVDRSFGTLVQLLTLGDQTVLVSQAWHKQIIWSLSMRKF